MILRQKIDHAWRWFGTAFSFAVFGVGGFLLPICVFPVLLVLPGDQNIRQQRAQKIIHYAFKTYIGMMRTLGVLSYQVEGLEKLKSAQLILANHPSLIDVVFLISMVPNANCVVKGKLTRNFFTKGPIHAAGYIINDGAESVIVKAGQAFEKGHALIIFPEGTRTTPSSPLQLKRGAANVAVRTRADITPVLITCDPTTLTKRDHWYQVPSRRVHFRLKVNDPICVSSYCEEMTPSVGARQLTRDLKEYFTQELEKYETAA